MVYLESRDTRSDFNLALEQHIFEQFPRDETYLMLWQNSSSVIVGKHQNTLEEVNVSFVCQQQIPVVRRLSGGGAVYHDLGNLNYTFIAEGKRGGTLDFSTFCQPLIQAVSALGVHAELTGRNDVTVDGRKFSGTAQYCRDGRIMHHGTILYQSDFTMLEKALAISPDRILSKGTRSVRSRVTNLRDHLPVPVPLEEFWEILRKKLTAGQKCSRGHFTSDDLEAAERLRRSKYATWEWNWGSSPPCTIRRERRVEGCGTIQVFLVLERGQIESCRFFGDFFGEGASPQLLKRLQGCKLEYQALLRALEGVDVDRCFYRLTGEELADLLAW